MAADDNGEGGQRQRRTTMACKIGQQTMKGKDKSGWQETAVTQSGDGGCGGGRWRRWTMTAVDDDNGNGGRQQRRTTTAAHNKGGG